MAINNLRKQLTQELLKSPKKAAILAVVLLVALYFWAPLVLKLFGTKEAPVASSIAPPIVAPATNKTALPADGRLSVPWHMAVEWMNSDPLKSLPTAFVSGRDPFENPNEPEQEIINPKIVKKTEELITPADLGLTLNSTIVSPGRSTASISGKVYRSGEEFKQMVKNHPVTIRLREVHPRVVVVEIDGKLFELKIAKPASDKVRIYQNE